MPPDVMDMEEDKHFEAHGFPNPNKTMKKRKLTLANKENMKAKILEMARKVNRPIKEVTENIVKGINESIEERA